MSSNYKIILKLHIFTTLFRDNTIFLKQTLILTPSLFIFIFYISFILNVWPFLIIFDLSVFLFYLTKAAVSVAESSCFKTFYQRTFSTFLDLFCFSTFINNLQEPITVIVAIKLVTNLCTLMHGLRAGLLSPRLYLGGILRGSR